MESTRAERLRAIFDEAAERPVVERPGFVHAACQGDASLEAEVASLLRSLETSSDALDVDAATWFGHAAGSVPWDSPGIPDGAPGIATDGGSPGIIVGDFRLVRLIGRGGIGAVYQAEQISLRRPVALKLLQSWTASRQSRRRFVEESAILARLNHPGIARVIAAGSRPLDLAGPDKSLAEGLFDEVQSLPWIAMELVDGARTILEACRGAPLDAVLRLFAQVADAVHYGHQQGFIHRDLKPANILVSARGEPKVIDFGIARAIGADRSPATTHEGALLGSPRYMCPEQCGVPGALLDTRSDVYSLGVVLYEAMTGFPPYETGDDSVAACMRAICEQPARDPRRHAPAIPTDAAMVVLKALSKDPGDRYQSAAEFAADLRRVIAREPVQARPSSTIYAAGMLMRRRPVMTGLVVLAMLGLIAGVVGITLGLSRERAARREADRAAWLANLTAADSSLRLGDGGSAMRRLDAIPQQQRGWEWRFLHALADTSESQWQVTDKFAGTFLSPSGRWAYCSHLHDGDTHADIIDTTNRQVVARIEDGLPSGTVIWNADESLIAIPRRDAVVLIDAKTGVEVRRWPQLPDRYPLGGGFNPDGSLLAIGLSEFAGVEVFDTRTGQTVFSKRSDSWVYSPAFSPDGGSLAWSNATDVERVEAATWTPQGSVATARVTKVEPGTLCYSPNGKLIAVTCGVEVQMIDTQTWVVRTTLRGHTQRIHSLSFDQSGNRLVTTSIDRTVRVWNALNGEPLTTLLGHESPTLQARFLPSQELESSDVISVDDASRIRTWSLKANGPVFSAIADETSPFINHLDFLDATSSHAATTTLRAVGQTSLITIDVDRRPSILSRDHFESHFLAVIPGEQLVLQNIAKKNLSLLSLVDDHVEWSRDIDPVFEFVVSPDGRLIAVLCKNSEIAILRVSDGVELGRTPAEPSGYHRPAFSPDGATLATLSRAGSLRLRNASDAALIAELAGEGDRANGLCWSTDGSLLAYAHAREGVTILDMRTRKPITTIEGVGGNVWSIAISPDKTRIAVGSQDRITHIYGVPSGDELLQIRNHTGTVMVIAWSPDGRYLATGGYDKRVFVYDSLAGEPAASAK